MSARAGVHRGDKDESRRVGRRAAGARDRDRTFLERLAQRVDHLPLVLGEFVEKERAGVRECL
jgi:hypothetical protein